MLLGSLLFGNKMYTDENFLERRAPIRTIPLHLRSIVQRKINGGHIYLEAGKGKPVIFIHGLFGGIYNADIVCREIAKEYRFIMPYLPMYDQPLLECTVEMLGEYLKCFIQDLGLVDAVVIGSSMGGGSALHYACKPVQKLKGIVLCGSSGLSSIPLSKGYFKRKNQCFVKASVQDIFFDRSIPPNEMVMDVFKAIQNNDIVKRSIRLTKSATGQNMRKQLPAIKTPTLLVWGKQDPITPVEIAPYFQELIPNATLRIVNKCGHVPTQERPYQFLEYFFQFMKNINP